MESTLRKSMVIGKRIIRFKQLQDMCGLSTWSYVTSTKRCNYDDGLESKRQCVYNNCPYWKRLERYGH